MGVVSNKTAPDINGSAAIRIAGKPLYPGSTAHARRQAVFLLIRQPFAISKDIQLQLQKTWKNEAGTEWMRSFEQWMLKRKIGRIFCSSKKITKDCVAKGK
jgi:hypothetical protein